MKWKDKLFKMKKLLYMILMLLCSFFSLTGCTSKKEEAMAVITRIPCEMAGVSFSLNGLWVIQEEADIKEDEGQTIALSTYQEETDSGIQVIYEDLTKTEGGTLVRMEDYIAGLQEQLKNSNEYKYSCGEVSTEELYGKSYETFEAFSQELGGTQKYYIRRQEDIMIVIVISLFGGEKLEDILALGKEM